ncbi:hypothetical protein M3689_14850 [Alkalihalophilus marmarensis]|uniref:hypothetical protein n=1 Tax=Alkalihalophilus marmarensis TaxID=521377 RepID=UPI00128E9887|nr:hypothetical protein [Alkalihalophilus marmarensis]MCM3490592.1 hypothetical protein [Alkalihalophilus marmarensis]
MLKEMTYFPFIYFIILTLFQALFREEITWFDNVMVAIIMYLIIKFVHWCMVPYNWSKKKS